MTTEVEMPKYKCHKVVHALKIARILENDNPDPTGRSMASSYGATIYPEDEGYDCFSVGPDFMMKHHPVVGGYYVVYADGYESYSPGPAFEAGYTRIVDSASDDRTKNNVMRHEYRTLSENEKIDMKAIKDAGLEFVGLIDAVAANNLDGMTRELALAKTKIEEAVMWAVKHITR